MIFVVKHFIIVAVVVFVVVICVADFIDEFVIDGVGCNVDDVDDCVFS